MLSPKQLGISVAKIDLSSPSQTIDRSSNAGGASLQGSPYLHLDSSGNQVLVSSLCSLVDTQVSPSLNEGDQMILHLGRDSAGANPQEDRSY